MKKEINIKASKANRKTRKRKQRVNSASYRLAERMLMNSTHGSTNEDILLRMVQYSEIEM